MCTTTVLVLLISVNYATSERDNRIITTLKYSKNYIYPAVVNGLPVKVGQVPYIVSIKELVTKVSTQRSLWANLCGGSILNPTKVLTAAHCFEYKNYVFLKHPKKLRVVAGDFMTKVIHSGNTETNEECQWRKISKVVMHRKYFFPNNDIALVFVNKPWRFTMNVGYIVPASRRTDYLSNCISAGFGDVKTKKSTSPILLVGTIFLMPRYNCNMIWEMNMDKFICSYSVFSDASYGDSGGPLSCKGTLDPAERTSKRKELLVGVVSGKNFDKTTLFTRVSEYRHWIDTNVAQRLNLSLLTLLINYVMFMLYL